MILLTGGAGYIGTHLCVELLNAGYKVVVFDNLSNSHIEALRRVKEITAKDFEFVQGDVRNQPLLEKVLRDYSCQAVIHLAGLKSVADSLVMPLEYWDNNFVGTLRLLQAMKNTGVKKLIFSSSATVYGRPQFLPITENHSLSAENPYGQTKLAVENLLRDYFNSSKDWSIYLLRYFNPVGAHESGLIGEDPKGIPNNLMPFLAQVAAGQRDCLSVFGSDYPTVDGTGVRDYIHVVDLALGHLKALQNLSKTQCAAVNLGTGVGYSVYQMINTFEKISGKSVPFVLAPRREGDVAECYACPDFARTELGWQAERGIDAMLGDHWRWQSANPKGYGNQ